MKITVDISMYPLDADYKPPIKGFIQRLRRQEGIQLVTNQMSTQVNGDFEHVMQAVNECMQDSMAEDRRVVFVARYLNADLEIGREPDIGG